MICKLVLILISVSAIVAAAFSASAQPTRAVDSWLDRSLANWNRQGPGLPSLPRPPAPAGDSPLANRCRDQVRQPASAAERTVVRRGWTLFGPVQSYATTTVFTAMAGVDGMCRPLGYQAFVYAAGRYAGTLSPVPMDSRTDSSLANIRLISSTTITAEFARYSESDPLCCPSKTSTVNYRVRNLGTPDVMAVAVTTEAPCPASEPAPGGNDNDVTSLFGKRWVLTAIGEQRLSADKPYIEFDQQQRRVSGDGGCNRFSGGFEINGTSLRLTRLISTKRACLAAEANRLETRFLQLLGETTRFEVQGRTLRLYAGDRQLLVFTSQ